MRTDLPIEEIVPKVRSALCDPGIALLTAPAGSGKTTVVPLRLLDEPWLDNGRIVVLEPRRIATRAAAGRMAELLGENVGETVGYVTRNDRQVSARTRIEVVTEGILTRRIQRDPELTGIKALLFDEVHERNLQTDLGLALALDVRESIRPDLRILLMSATIDAEQLASRLASEPVPIITGDSRTHPVDIRWVPQQRRQRIEDGAARLVRQVLDTEPGDILVFLPGVGEIRRTETLLRSDLYADVIPLHGSLSAADQDRAIRPSSSGRPKVILSTDIAETSITVEGTRVVIDSGLARAPRFDARTGMTRLQTINVSKASADQRAGRAGRTEPGIALRMWSKIEHAARPSQIQPEITQVDLAGLMLELANWGVSDPASLTFLDQPPPAAVREARDLLVRLGALTDGQITPSGREIAQLPTHPRLARMIVDSGIDQSLACLVAALLDDRDIIDGRPDEVPTDLGLRIQVVEGQASHPRAARSRVDRVRRNARDLMRRADAPALPADHERTGSVLTLAYPDRLAIRRGGRGRFQMRTGTTAWMHADDGLAGEQFLMAVDLDGKRKDTRIRLAAALTADEVAEHFADEVTGTSNLEWNGTRLTEVRRRRIGGLTLDEVAQRPSPSADVTRTLLAKIAERNLRDLNWSKATQSLRDRVIFLHSAMGDPWPDWSHQRLVETIDDWLGPYVVDPTRLDDVVAVDIGRVLRSGLSHHQVQDLDRLAPKEFILPSGRSVTLDYSSGTAPTLSVRVQDLYGVAEHPTAGGMPLVLELLSPANRPIQITSDLPGFWTGSWKEVRKEMAGRYPKHNWPENPS